MLKPFLTFLVFTAALMSARTQAPNWTAAEKINYKTIRDLCAHYENRRYDTSDRTFLFKNYIYFDNILADDSMARVQSRLTKFDGLFGVLLHFVDSVGLENLDAVPTRMFKDSREYFEPFLPGGDLHEALPNCLTYFDRRRPKMPLGTLVFEEKTHRMFSWIVLNQGGSYYFLTFSLL